jgi:hypothetical protein
MEPDFDEVDDYIRDLKDALREMIAWAEHIAAANDPNRRTILLEAKKLV